MKKVVLAGFMLAYSAMAFAQPDSYAGPGTWGANVVNPYTSPLGCVLVPATSAYGSMTIASGRMNLNAVKGACENRIAKPLGNIYDTQFNIDFEMRLAETGSYRPGFYPVLLSSQNLNPEFVIPMTVCMQRPVMDVLAVRCYTLDPLHELTLSVWTMDNGGTPVVTGAIVIEYDVTYYGRVRIFDNERGEFQLFSDAGYKNLINSFCFDFPRRIRGLTFMQHATSSQGSLLRLANGWVDNTNVYNTDNDCCNISLSGPNFICGSDSSNDSSTYVITTTGTNPEFEVPEGVTFIENPDGSITVTDWGTLSGSPTIIPITATSLCMCNTIQTTLNVYVYPAADFNIVGLGNSGSNLTNFSAVSDPTPSGTQHTWDVWESDLSHTLISLVRGPFTQTSTGSGSTYAVNATSPSPTLVTDQIYLVRHTIVSPDGVCTTETERLIFISESLILNLPYEEYKNLTPEELADLIKRSSRLSGVRVYPNPTSSMVTVESDTPTDRWELLDAAGKTVLRGNGGRNSFQVDLGTYAKGLYLIKLYQGDKISTQKIVVE